MDASHTPENPHLVSMGNTPTGPSALEDIGPNDILIALAGNTGVGKSTFINKAAGEDLLPIGQTPKPNNEVQYVVCSNPDLYGNQRVVLLEIPAFDSESDERIIEDKIRRWLQIIILKELEISGILYLHNMTETYFSDASLKHLTALVTLCERFGKGTVGVLLLLTMQALLPRSALLQRKKGIQDKWNICFTRGVLHSRRFENSSDSAWENVMDLTTYLDDLAKQSGAVRSFNSQTHSQESYVSTCIQPTVTRPQLSISTTDILRSPVKQQSDSSVGSQHISSPLKHLDSSSGPYDRSRILISELAASRVRRTPIIELEGDEAQWMVDFLDVVLEEKNALRTTEGERIFSVLTKLAKSTQLFPRRYRLPGVKCDFKLPWNQGGFGDIYSGLCGDREVCVKVVRIYLREDNQTKLREHIKELILWAHHSHPNIIPFCGAYLSPKSLLGICIVSPRAKYGDLSKYVKHFPERPRIPLLSDVIAGLGYLHRSKITHADLKAANVLVSISERAMIADFGTSLSESVTNTRISHGTLYWMAPELLLHNNLQPTQKSDIWSFGCLCFEVLTRKTPFQDRYNETVQLVVAYAKGEATLVRPPAAFDYDRIDDQFWSLILRCCRYKPEERLDCEDIQQFIVDVGVKDSRIQSPEDTAFWEEKRAQSKVEIDYSYLERILLRCKAEGLQRLSSLLMSVIGNPQQRALILRHSGDSSQHVANYLGQILRYGPNLSHEKIKLMLSVLYELRSLSPVHIRYYDFVDIQIDDTRLVMEDPSSNIYVGRYNDQKICLKLFHHTMDKRLFRALTQESEEFIRWAHISHPNILPLYGVHFFSNHLRIGFAFPWMENESIFLYLRKYPQTPRMPLILDIVDGLSFLHHLDMAHGDLRGANILVSDDGRALISNEAPAVFTRTQRSTRALDLRNGFRWIAPEMIGAATVTKATKEGDIWSLGCLCYEILSGPIQYPYDRDVVAVLISLACGKAPTRFPEPTTDTGIYDSMLWDSMTECWNQLPQRRPTCDEIKLSIASLELPDIRPQVQRERNIAFWDTAAPEFTDGFDYDQVYNTLNQVQDTIP